MIFEIIEITLIIVANIDRPPFGLQPYRVQPLSTALCNAAIIPHKITFVNIKVNEAPFKNLKYPQK